MREKKSEKLIRLLREEFGFCIKAKSLRRSYAGRHQLSQGACLWYATTETLSSIISWNTVTELLKEWPNIKILPESIGVGYEIWTTKDAPNAKSLFERRV